MQIWDWAVFEVPFDFFCNLVIFESTAYFFMLNGPNRKSFSLLNFQDSLFGNKVFRLTTNCYLFHIILYYFPIWSRKSKIKIIFLVPQAATLALDDSHTKELKCCVKSWLRYFSLRRELNMWYCASSFIGSHKYGNKRIPNQIFEKRVFFLGKSSHSCYIYAETVLRLIAWLYIKLIYLLAADRKGEVMSYLIFLGLPFCHTYHKFWHLNIVTGLI